MLADISATSWLWLQLSRYYCSFLVEQSSSNHLLSEGPFGFSTRMSTRLVNTGIGNALALNNVSPVPSTVLSQPVLLGEKASAFDVLDARVSTPRTFLFKFTTLSYCLYTVL